MARAAATDLRRGVRRTRVRFDRLARHGRARSLRDRRASNRHFASFCPQGAFSDASAELTPFSPDPGAGGFLDGAGTVEADPANTLSYRVNLTKCLEPEGISFGVDQTRGFAFQVTTPQSPEQGVTGADGASQVMYFRRTGSASSTLVFGSRVR